MMNGRGWQRTGWQILLLLWLGLMPWLEGVAKADLVDLRSKLQGHEARYSALSVQYKKERQRVQVLADRLEGLKQEAERGGLFALPARLRLSSLRSQAQTLAKAAEAIESRLRAEEAEGQIVRSKLQAELRKEIRAIRIAADKASGAEKSRLQEREKAIRQELAALSKTVQPQATKDVQPWTIRLNPLDGPQEIRQKADALKDMEDRVSARLQALQKRVSQMKRQIQRTKSDQQLEKQVSEMTSDEELFDEQDRNPRVVAGSREQGTRITSDDRTLQSGSPTASTSSRTPPPQAGSTESKSGSNSPVGVGPAAVGTDSTRSPGSTTDPGSFQAGTPGASAQATSPRVGLLPTPHLSGKTADPMNPSGSPEDQLKALQKYQEELKRKLEDLRKQHRDFLKKASQIEKEESRSLRR